MRFALGPIVPGYGICQSVFKMALGRMDRDARSLIYDQNILILIDNGKGSGEGMMCSELSSSISVTQKKLFFL